MHSFGNVEVYVIQRCYGLIWACSLLNAIPGTVVGSMSVDHFEGETHGALCICSLYTLTKSYQTQGPFLGFWRQCPSHFSVLFQTTHAVSAVNFEEDQEK